MMINDVNMKKFLFIVALFVQQIDVIAVTVERTVNLNVYYPEYTKIDLICGQMPKAAQKDVEFCCEAAFTGELLNEFKHSNIADNHICNGEMRKGYSCKANTGGFVWGKGKWQFMRKADYPKCTPEPTLLCSKLFGRDFEDAHDAASDIEATQQCFWELRKKGLI